MYGKGNIDIMYKFVPIDNAYYEMGAPHPSMGFGNLFEGMGSIWPEMPSVPKNMKDVSKKVSKKVSNKISKVSKKMSNKMLGVKFGRGKGGSKRKKRGGSKRKKRRGGRGSKRKKRGCVSNKPGAKRRFSRSRRSKRCGCV